MLTLILSQLKQRMCKLNCIKKVCEICWHNFFRRDKRLVCRECSDSLSIRLLSSGYILLLTVITKEKSILALKRCLV